MPRLRMLSPTRRPKVTQPPDVVEPSPVVAELPAVDVAVAEVLGFPIRWLRELPLPSTLACSFAHEGGRQVLLCTASPPAQADPSVPVFVGPEVDALTLAAEHERASAATLSGWLAKKPGGWRLTRIEALGAVAHATPPLGWTTGQVLRALGLRLDEVWL
jgi:hypothetical protein